MSPSRAAVSISVADTGPLLCAGAMGKEGLHVLYSRFKKNGVTLTKPAVVESELANQARNHGDLRNAANLLLGRRASFIETDRTSWSDRQRDHVRTKVIAEVTASATARRQVPVVAGHHDGEVDAILLAQAHGSILLCNDRPAIRVARSLGLTVATFADVLSAAMRDNHIDSEKVNDLLPRIEAVTFLGIHDPSALNISTRPPVPGL